MTLKKDDNRDNFVVCCACCFYVKHFDIPRSLKLGRADHFLLGIKKHSVLFREHRAHVCTNAAQIAEVYFLNSLILYNPM